MNIEQYLDALIKREGGYVNDVFDSGHATKYGITQAVARSYGYQGEMKENRKEKIQKKKNKL